MELPPSVSRLPGAPRVLVSADDALAFISAPTGASSFFFGSGVNSFSRAATVDVVAPTRPPSPTPATPLPSAHAEARRRLPLRQTAAGDTRGQGTQPRSSCRTAARTALRPTRASAVTPPTRTSAVGAPLAAGEGS
jgi:hypothetical protein